jgi:hypothetical protein
MYSYWHVCMLCSVYSSPTGILRLPWPRVFGAFSSVVRQMLGYTSQRQGTVRTLPYYWTVLFYVLFVCKCVLYYCHRVSTQLKLNVSYHIIYHIISYHIIYHIIYHISYHIISYHTISYNIIYLSYISYHISYHLISYIISYRHACHIISYIIYRIVLYHIISYHTISYHIIN